MLKAALAQIDIQAARQNKPLDTASVQFALFYPVDFARKNPHLVRSTMLKNKNYWWKEKKAGRPSLIDIVPAFAPPQPAPGGAAQ